jgi:carbonic anhydrase
MRDDDPSKIESMVKEEKMVPLDFHFVHIETNDGELIRIE